MAKIVLITNNSILNQLYEANFVAYLNAEVWVAYNLEDALKLIGDEVNIYLIQNQAGCPNYLDSFIAALGESKKKICVLGSVYSGILESDTVPVTYDLKIILRFLAKKLNLSFQDLALQKVDEFIPIRTSLFSNFKTAPSKIYIKIDNNEFQLFANKDVDIKKNIEIFMEEEVDFLYVNKFDRLQVVNEATAMIAMKMNQIVNDPTIYDFNQKSKMLNQSFELISSVLGMSEISKEETMALAENCTAVMRDLVKEESKLSELIKLLVSNKSGYLYSHSIIASYVSQYIIKRVAWGGDSHLDKLNFVLFFHDITLVPIYQKYTKYISEEDLLFNKDLTNDEKELIINHARDAAELVISYRKLPLGAEVLIRQHHGMNSGIGFANEFKDDVSPLAKVIMVAESFVHEYQLAGRKNIDEVIAKLEIKFPKHSYRKIIEALKNIPV